MDAQMVTLQYDQSLRPTALMAFLKIWRPFFPWLLPVSLIILACGSVVYAFAPGYDGFAWALAAIVGLNLIHWTFSYRRYLRKFEQVLRGTAALTVDADSMSLTLGEQTAKVPWSKFKEAFRDSQALLLFTGRAQFLIIPTRGVPESVLRVIEDHIPQ